MILVLGSYGTGITLRVPRIPERGETLGGAVLSIGYGGKSSNQAVAARRQGADVELLTAVGNDAFGQDAFAMWKAEGVGAEGVEVVDSAATMAGAILVEPSGDNRIAIAPGALDTMSASWLESKADLFNKATLLVVCLECPTEVVDRAVRMAKERNLPVVLNPAPAAELSAETIGLADYFAPNETEYAFYQKSGYERVPGQTLIVTRGESGVRVVNDDGERDFKPLKQDNVVDTTGAGDTFVGTFAAALDEGLDLAEAVERAIVSSSISVTGHEVVPAIPHREKVDEALASYRGGAEQ